MMRDRSRWAIAGETFGVAAVLVGGMLFPFAVLALVTFLRRL